MTVLTRAAPAKINLYLHVTGRRDDGYHLLDSLVVFAGTADSVSAGPGPGPENAVTLDVTGPFAAAAGPGEDNLALLAARALQREAGRALAPVALAVWKELPAAAGLGGGSADAAAALRVLDRFWALGLDEAALARLALSLGADVPMCLAGCPARARGVGADLAPLAFLPPLHIVLVNPGTPVPTDQVFGALTRRDTPLDLADPVFAARTPADFAAVLARMRNDLEAAAIGIEPVIAQVLDRLAHTDGCLLVRMSGSGATCFALYGDARAALKAAGDIATDAPGWWVRASALRHEPPAVTG